MTDDEKQAIKYFYNLRATIDESYMLFDEEINVKCGKETIKQISVVLNLIEKKQKEIEKKDKIIELMAKDIKSTDKFLETIGHLGEYSEFTIENIIEEYTEEYNKII